MFLPDYSVSLRAIFSRPTQAQLAAARLKWRALAGQLLPLLLTYALLLQLVPRIVVGAPSGSLVLPVEKQAAKNKDAEFSSQFVQAGANGWSEVFSAISAGSDVPRNLSVLSMSSVKDSVLNTKGTHSKGPF